MKTNTYHQQTARFLSTLATCMPTLAGDVMQGWINNPKTLKRVLTQALCPPEVQLKPNSLIVPAGLSFEKRIALGRYDRVNDDITTERFPIGPEQCGEWEWKLFRFDGNISSEEAIRLMREEGFEPGQTGHILAFGEQDPEKQCKSPVIALGQSVEIKGGRHVLGLWLYHGEQSLDLDVWNGVWAPNCCFLAVR